MGSFSIPSTPLLSTLPGAATGLANLSAIALVTPNSIQGYQPQPVVFNGTVGPQQPAMLFHYEGDNVANIESDVTDHFVEDNTAIQDHVALKPVTVKVEGFIGELIDFIPSDDLLGAVAGYAKIAEQKLQLISGYTPELSITAINAYNNAFAAYQTAVNQIQAAQSLVSSITSNITGLDDIQTKQQQYFNQFYAYWASRTLFTIQTPWAIFTDMVIQSMKSSQSADTRMITSFSMEFKQLRFATTLVEQIPRTPIARAAIGLSPTQNNGNTVAATSSTSFTSMVGNLQ